MLNIVIIDDDIQQLDYTESKLLELPIEDVHIRKYFDEEIFLRELRPSDEYSIFLIDIVLRKNSGIDIARLINEYIKGAIIIFVSSHLNKVVDVYDANHCYFIYKPELERRLPIAINKAIDSLSCLKKTISIPLKNKTIILHDEDIIYFERTKRITTIVCSSNTIDCSYKLEYFIPKLLPYFIRCHRSYIVNLTKVKEYRRTEFVLEDGTIIAISRAYSKYAKEKFQDFLMNKL